jgi:RimJ/RimL family protein N-acetyltransferase
MGVATKAVGLMVGQARANVKIQSMHAYPSSDNGPSNKICMKAGFTLRGEVSFEYPPGHFMRCNDWCLDLVPIK